LNRICGISTQPITRTGRRWQTDRAPPLALALVLEVVRQAPGVEAVVEAEVAALP
jgi:hypothetical protein